VVSTRRSDTRAKADLPIPSGSEGKIVTVASTDKLLPWLERLAGLEQDRSSDAISVLRTWKLDHIERELFRTPDLDTISAAVLLVESVDALCAQGVQRTKLMKKLRDARSSLQFWPAWAEIRGAAMLIGRDDYGVRIEIEPDAVKGRMRIFDSSMATTKAWISSSRASACRTPRWHGIVRPASSSIASCRRKA
jgi:hypothetical protein